MDGDLVANAACVARWYAKSGAGDLAHHKLQNILTICTL